MEIPGEVKEIFENEKYHQLATVSAEGQQFSVKGLNQDLSLQDMKRREKLIVRGKRGMMKWKNKGYVL